MVKKYRQFITSCLMGVDLFVISFSWVLSYWFRFYSGVIPINKGIPQINQYVWFLPFVIFVWLLVSKGMSLYMLLCSKSGIDEFCEMIKLSTISVLILIACTFFYRQYSYSRTVMILYWVVSSLMLTLSHMAVKKLVLLLRRRGYRMRTVLVVGAGNLGQCLVERINKHPEIGLEIVGFLSEHLEKIGKKYSNTPVIDHIDNLKKTIGRMKPDELYIALPLDAHRRLESVITQLGNESIDVKVVSDLYRFMKLNGGVEVFDGLPIINLSEGPLWGWNRFVKRMLDIVFASAAIILFFPVMIIISLIIGRTSKGSIFYKQERMGLDGKKFVIYKFRSMVLNAENEAGAVWAKKGDNRTTSFGKWLRMTSLDELPQFFNVLTGDMSFVGPRPERPVFVDEFKKSVPLYMLRHKMKSGITGWAQVNGWRGNTSLEKRIEHDLYYIENWSLFFDLKILWLTLWKGFIGKNAY